MTIPALNQVPLDRGRKLLDLPGGHALWEADLSEATRAEVAKLAQASAQLEATLARQMLKEMAPKGLGGEGPMGDFAREQFLGAIADVVGRSGALGIAEMLRERVSENIYRQEVARLRATPDREQP